MAQPQKDPYGEQNLVEAGGHMSLSPPALFLRERNNCGSSFVGNNRGRPEVKMATGPELRSLTKNLWALGTLWESVS